MWVVDGMARHALTINQANLAERDTKEVMKSMQSFIQDFFSCRECAIFTKL